MSVFVRENAWTSLSIEFKTLILGEISLVSTYLVAPRLSTSTVCPERFVLF